MENSTDLASINFAITSQSSHFSSEKQNQHSTTHIHWGGGGDEKRVEKGREKDPEPYLRKLASPYLQGKSADKQFTFTVQV